MSELPRPRPLPRPHALLAVVRLRVRRFRLARWAAAVVLGGAVAVSTSGVLADAEARRAHWSTVDDIWVLTADVPAGATLEPSVLEQRAMPRVAVPDSALGVDDQSPMGRRLRVAGHRGEVVLAPRLAPVGASAVAARLPAGTRGVVVPTAEPDPFVEGDTTDLFELVSGRRLVEGALVVAVAPGGATVAVGSEQVGAVVAALAGGGIVATLVP